MLKLSPVFVTSLLLPALATAAPPAPDFDTVARGGPEAIVREADRRHSSYTDQTLRVRMTAVGGSDDGRTLETTTITAGDGRRAVRFHEPADMRGMGVVVKGRDEIYVRLPDTRKVRRVASHARRQSFQGTDWSFDDMALITFADDFEPTGMEDQGGSVRIRMRPRPGHDPGYDEVALTIDKSVILIWKIEYFRGGRQVKEQVRSELQTLPDGHKLYKVNLMKDLVKKHATRTVVLEAKNDQGVPPSTFSKRWLVRGL